jgi:DNA-binding transcriptional LysR family regulator
MAGCANSRRRRITLYGRLPELIRRYRAVRPGVELTLLELTTLEQIAVLKEGRIDVGYGRIPFDDPAIERTLLRNEPLSAALPGPAQPLFRRTRSTPTPCLCPSLTRSNRRGTDPVVSPSTSPCAFPRGYESRGIHIFNAG